MAAGAARGWLWWSGFALLALLCVAAGTAVALALHFQARPAPAWIALWLGALATALVLPFRRGLRAGFGLLTAGLVVFGLWWSTIRATNDRDWSPEVAELATSLADAAAPGRIAIRNVRDFRWITPDEAAPRWETRSYDLDALTGVDLVLTYWAGPAIAHTMVSFGFANGEHVVFSVGIRPARGQAYSSLAGFFKAYELIVTVADERDAIGLRTSVQEGNSVHLYRLAMPPALARGLFREYMELADGLAERPRFYRTIVANCTTVIWSLVRRLDPRLPFDWRVLLPGYLPGYLHEIGALDPRFPLAEIEAMSALPADVPLDLDGRDYSAALRQGIPPLSQEALHRALAAD